MVLKRLAERVDSFLARYLDSEGVMLFQVIVYIHMALAGFYGLFIAGGIPPDLARAVPHDAHRIETAWLILLTLGLLTLIGRGLVASQFAGNRASIYTLGAWLQFTGDLAMTWGFGWYVLASWGSAYCLHDSSDVPNDQEERAPGVSEESKRCDGFLAPERAVRE